MAKILMRRYERDSIPAISVVTSHDAQILGYHAKSAYQDETAKRLSTTALSQCNTHIILRVTNPMDIQHIEDSSEGITADIVDMIPGLKVGEALIVGEAVNYPLLVKIRERRSKKLEKGMKFEEALRKFKERKILEAKDLDSFM